VTISFSRKISYDCELLKITDSHLEVKISKCEVNNFTPSPLSNNQQTLRTGCSQQQNTGIPVFGEFSTRKAGPFILINSAWMLFSFAYPVKTHLIYVSTSFSYTRHLLLLHCIFRYPSVLQGPKSFADKKVLEKLTWTMSSFRLAIVQLTEPSETNLLRGVESFLRS
jgi:hypothetical protein